MLVDGRVCMEGDAHWAKRVRDRRGNEVVRTASTGMGHVRETHPANVGLRRQESAHVGLEVCGV